VDFSDSALARCSFKVSWLSSGRARLAIGLARWCSEDVAVVHDQGPSVSAKEMGGGPERKSLEISEFIEHTPD
jgi:hypothetical protein